MQRWRRMRRAPLLLLCLALSHAAQRSASKTLPVPYSPQGGLLQAPTSPNPLVTGFQGVDGPAPARSQTFVLLYDDKYAGSELAGADRAIEAAGGTVVAQYPAIGVAFATSANGTFAADVKAADPRLVHVAITAGMPVGGRRKASIEKSTGHNRGDGSRSLRGSGGGGGGGCSNSKLKDSSEQSVGCKEGAGARMSSEEQGSAPLAAKRRRLSLEPVQAPSLEGIDDNVLASSPSSMEGVGNEAPIPVRLP